MIQWLVAAVKVWFLSRALNDIWCVCFCESARQTAGAFDTFLLCIGICGSTNSIVTLEALQAGSRCFFSLILSWQHDWLVYASILGHNSCKLQLFWQHDPVSNQDSGWIFQLGRLVEGLLELMNKWTAEVFVVVQSIIAIMWSISILFLVLSSR